ncbi:MAG: precorrin-6y C5,15-methyltransferase (decarboxylating) subunit CbiE [Collinsella sp.]
MVAALTDAASWQRAVVVMTGDVGLFSGARRLVEALSGDARVDVRVIPGISSASYLAARLARPWQDWRFASAHGVACDIVAEAERAGELFLATSGGEDPSRLSGELGHAGFGDARVTVAERLSYPDERITCATASEIAGQTFDDLNVMLIDFAGGAGSSAGSSAASEAPAGASARAAASSAADSAGAFAPRAPLAVRFLGHSRRALHPRRRSHDQAEVGRRARSCAPLPTPCGTSEPARERVARQLVARAGSVWRSSATRPAWLIRENADAFGAATYMSPVSPCCGEMPVPDAVFVMEGGLLPLSWRRRSRRPAGCLCAMRHR